MCACVGLRLQTAYGVIEHSKARFRLCQSVLSESNGKIGYSADIEFKSKKALTWFLTAHPDNRPAVVNWGCYVILDIYSLKLSMIGTKFYYD